MQCQAFTIRGHQCKKIININENFCYCHSDKEKKLGNKKLGQSIKSRAASSRNGAVISVANTYCEQITPEMIKERNEVLNLSSTKCNYCGKCGKYCKFVKDHLSPSCSSKKSIYSLNNELNIIIACHECNESKSSKTGEEFYSWLKYHCKKPDIEINKWREWINENKKYLLFNEKDTIYLNEQFETINLFHEIAQKSLENREDIGLNLYKILRDKYKDTCL